MFYKKSIMHFRFINLKFVSMEMTIGVKFKKRGKIQKVKEDFNKHYLIFKERYEILL